MRSIQSRIAPAGHALGLQSTGPRPAPARPPCGSTPRPPLEQRRGGDRRLVAAAHPAAERVARPAFLERPPVHLPRRLRCMPVNHRHLLGPAGEPLLQPPSGEYIIANDTIVKNDIIFPFEAQSASRQRPHRRSSPASPRQTSFRVASRGSCTLMKLRSSRIAYGDRQAPADRQVAGIVGLHPSARYARRCFCQAVRAIYCAKIDRRTDSRYAVQMREASFGGWPHLSSPCVCRVGHVDAVQPAAEAGSSVKP
jgi:hypothetical protein